MKIAFTGATVFTMEAAREKVEFGTVLVDGAKIAAAGEGIEVPAEYRAVDARGKYITPGLLDAHTHLGVHPEAQLWAGEDYEEKYTPITPEVHVKDSFYPFDVGLYDTCGGGVTTVMVTPGSDNPIGGQCMIVKTRPRANVDDMILREYAGLKIAFGENPRKYHGTQQKAPMTRMGIAALLRKSFRQGQTYLHKKESGAAIEIDYGLEAIAKVLRREMPLRAHAHRVDDILTAIRIAEEFDLDIIIEHGTEGHLIADVLAAKKIPVAAGPLLKTRGKMEIINRSWLTPAVFEASGVRFAMISDHSVIPSRFLPVYAGIAARFGLSELGALRSLTSDAAKILAIDDRVGSLAPGKDADLVVWSAHPLESLSRPEIVMIDGALGRVEMQAGQQVTNWEE